uniref:Uncharacterized protein n=1 Tax=Panagrolaimus davidi TaxID=227884 RepID=A0A914QQU2_9BILA
MQRTLKCGTTSKIEDENQTRVENAAARLRMQMRRNTETKLCAAAFEIDDNGDYGGPLNFICTNCGAKHFENVKVSNKGLTFSGCCQHEAIKFKIPDYPEDIKKNFDLTEFRKDIQPIYNVHSFGSFNADVVNLGVKRPEPYAFVVHGQVYYHIYTCLENEPEQPKSHGQLYIANPEEAVQNGIGVFNRLNPDIVKNVSTILSEINVQAKLFKCFMNK